MPPLTFYFLLFIGLTLVNAAIFYARYRAKEGGNKKSLTEESSKEKSSNTNKDDGENDLSIDLQPGEHLRVTIEKISKKAPKTKSGAGKRNIHIFIDPAGKIKINPGLSTFGLLQLAAKTAAWLRAKQEIWPYSLSQTLFGAAVLIYLTTRLIGLSDYPIYFFADEAVQTNLAGDFVRDNFRNYEGELFPTYFKNVDKYSLGLTVYAQVIPYLLLGKSIFVTRAVVVLFSLAGVVWLSLLLRDVFKISYWWGGLLVLSITPVWFLHSRTAFETVTMVSLYTGFLYYYLLYRTKNPNYLYASLGLGALSFYSYNPGRIVIILTGLLFFLSDIKFHFENRKITLRSGGLLLLLAAPFIRFQMAHPAANVDQLKLLASYWVQPLPLSEKLASFGSKYLLGLSPGYWYIPNEHDLARHLMNDFGNIFSILLPFAIAGLLIALKSIRSSPHRAMLLAMLATPSGAALVGIGNTRVLAFVIPATLFAMLGINASLSWLEKRGYQQRLLSIGLFLLLGGFNIWLLNTSLKDGPTWHTDYSLGGMQYGGRQINAAITDYMDENPDSYLIVSPNWANSPNIIADFFFPDGIPFQFGSIVGHMFSQMPLDESTVFVTTPEEYEALTDSGKFTDIQIEQIVPYPDETPGFYFLKLSYVDNIEELLARESEERRVLIEDVVIIDEEEVAIKYSLLDMGGIQMAFDGDPFTVARTLEANPFVIDLEFPKDQTFNQINIIVSSATVEVTIEIYSSEDDDPSEYSGVFSGTVDEPEIILQLPKSITSDHIRLFIRDLNQPEPGHIHVWEVKFIEVDEEG